MILTLAEPARIEYRIPHVTVAARCPWQEEMVVAVWRSEGGDRARQPFGVLSQPVRSRIHARSVVVESIQASWLRFNRAGCPGGCTPDAFVTFFAKRWVPYSSDPKGHVRWIANAKRILAAELAKRPVFKVP